MLSDELELTLKRALSIAENYKHEYATYEHLLMSLTSDADVQLFLKSKEISIEPLVLKLGHYLATELSDIVEQSANKAKPTISFQRIIQRAALHAHTNQENNICCGINVLIELFFEKKSYAFLCLKELKITRVELKEFLKKRPRQLPMDSAINHLDQFRNSFARKASPSNNLALNIQKQEALHKHAKMDKEQEKSDLEKYCINLNKKANLDTIDCLIGRKDEVQRTIEILCRRKKNNAILVGEPGVGKTAIAEGLAVRIVNKDVPEFLQKAVIYALDVGSLVAGTKFRGDFEERIKNLLESLRNDHNAILFIDEIHTIIGAGSTTAGSMDASNLLKPALAKGELKCIGSTTFKEYHNHFEKDMALVRRFQKIIVREPDENVTLEILRGLKGYYEKHHNVIYSPAALKAAISLSERFINDRNLPDKAIDLMDEAGARSKLDNKRLKTTTIITEQDIKSLIASIVNIPNLNFEAEEASQLKNLSENLKKMIFGQDEAIDILCSSIKLSRAGLRKGTRPTGCYMFAGPTGVGKTELAKQLAILNNMKLLKFDMSEFCESNATSKLLGSAPGYVGFDQGGMLTDEVDKFPYSVVLFDEIEKANPEIFNLLLQIMDEGKLTDNTGKQINFSHTIIILTTNIIAGEKRTQIGFAEENKADFSQCNQRDMKQFAEHFNQEFLSRLDQIVLFNPINNVLQKIVSKNLEELESQLANKKVELITSNGVLTYLVNKCSTSKNGARELDRIIDSSIKKAIADELLFGKLQNGGVVDIGFSLKNQELIFKFSGLKEASERELEIS